MPRKKRDRRLLAPPVIQGLLVHGPKHKSEQILLYFEEYETIKLLDYDNMSQEEAAVCMNISRPTLTRIYESARNKVAASMVEGKDIAIKSGNFYFDESWYYCNSCKSKFTLFPKKNGKVCPVCGSQEIVTLNEYYDNDQLRRPKKVVG